MFLKLTVIACSLAVATARYKGPLAGGLPAALYPADLDPKACPNFPNCVNPAVAVIQVPEQSYDAPQRQYQSAPLKQYQTSKYTAAQYQPQRPQQYQTPRYQPKQYQSPQSNQYPAAPQNQYSREEQKALDRGEYIGDGDYHGEGLAEALAPGYSGQHQTYQAAPAFKFHSQPTQAPAARSAGVACPNYPYCH